MDNALSLEKYTKLVIKDWKIIVYFRACMLFLTIIYGLFMYKPNYKSNVEILVKNQPQVSFVTELNSENLTPLNQNDNPVLSQIEILSSFDLIDKIINKLEKDSDFLQKNPNFSKYTVDQLEDNFKQIIKLKNPPGTDVITMSICWNNPDDAKKIAKYYLDTYLAFDSNLNKKAVAQMRLYIKKQLAKSTNDLAKIRNDIRTYRKNNKSVDVLP